MTLIECKRCKRIFPVANNSGDVVHECDSGNATLDNEDIIRLDTPDWFQQGAANRASVRARVHGEFIEDRNTRGNIKSLIKTRQHYEYINLQEKGI